jgi:hypothetical protein
MNTSKNGIKKSKLEFKLKIGIEEKLRFRVS